MSSNPSDFQQLAAMGPAGSGDGTEPSYDPRFGQELQQAMAQTPQMQAFRELGAQSKVNADLMKLPQPAEEMSMKTDPKTGQRNVTVKTTEQNFQNTMDSATKYHQVLAGFVQQSQQAEMRLRMQEEQARNQSPWIQLATALAANMAQAKDLPGWVQAAGRTSAQLNPRPEELAARRMAVIEQGAGMAEKGVALDIAQMRNLSTEQEQAANLKVKQEKEVRETGNRITSNIRLLTKPGEPLDPKVVEQIVQLNDPNGLLSPEQRKAAVDAAAGMATTAKAGKEAEVGRKKDLQSTAAQLALDRGLTLQSAGAGQKASLMREAFALNHGQSALDFEAAKRDVTNAANMKLAQAKSTGVISSSDSQKLQGGLATNTYLASIGDMLKKPEWGKVAQPLFSVQRGKDGSVDGISINPEATLPKSWQSVNKAEADNMIKHEIPRLLSLLFKQGVGAQMFRSKEGAKILMDLGISNSMRVDQMQAVLKTIRETNNTANFQPVAVTKPGVDWSNPENAAMLALDDPENADFWAGKGRFGGRTPVKNPAGGKTTPTLSKAGYDEWLKTQPRGQ